MAAEPSRPAPRTQAARREATRAALIDAGYELFAAAGYEAVSAERVVAVAGVTRGALYHHFDGKRGLFAAVYEEAERRLVSQFSVERLTGAEPFEALREGIDQFLELSLDPGIQRITLIDAPAVLGWAEWHEVQSRYGLGLLQASLSVAIEAGQLRELPVEELAAALLGALIEGALAVAAADDQQAATDRVRTALRALLDGLAS